MTTQPIAVDPKTAAKMLGVGIVKLYKIMSDGDIKGRKSGRSTLILVSDIHAYLENLPVATFTTMQGLKTEGRGCIQPRTKSAA